MQIISSLAPLLFFLLLGHTVLAGKNHQWDVVLYLGHIRYNLGPYDQSLESWSSAQDKEVALQDLERQQRNISSLFRGAVHSAQQATFDNQTSQIIADTYQNFAYSMNVVSQHTMEQKGLFDSTNSSQEVVAFMTGILYSNRNLTALLLKKLMPMPTSLIPGLSNAVDIGLDLLLVGFGHPA